MTPLDLARAIYEHHRRSKLKAPRRSKPAWEELTSSERHAKVNAAKRLLEAYERRDAREVRIEG